MYSTLLRLKAAVGNFCEPVNKLALAVCIADLLGSNSTVAVYAVSHFLFVVALSLKSSLN